jgi:HD superfamily phosphohydrolase
MFQQVYFHKASRSSEWLLSRILARVRELLIDGTRVEGVPAAVRHLALEDDAPLDDYLALDDSFMWTALSQFRKSKDSILSDLSGRLVSRKLFKALELFGDDATIEGRARCRDIARSLAKDVGLAPEVYVGLDVPAVDTFNDSKDSLTVMFPDGSERRPGEVSFLLSRLRGQTLARPRIIYPREIREALFAELGAGNAPERNQGGTLAGGTFGADG